MENKGQRAEDSELLNSGNPQSTDEGEDELKQTPITTQVEEASARLLKSGEVRVGVPEVQYQGTSARPWLQINNLHMIYLFCF